MTLLALNHSVSQLSYLTLVLLAIILVLFLWLFALSTRLNRVLRQQRNLLRGAHPGNILDVLENAIKQGLQTRSELEQVLARFSELGEYHRLAFQKAGLVRFDAFDGVGGQQSFALALLDGNSDGVVLSSLFGREGARIYAKPVENGRSTYNLSQEERQAIEQAVKPARQPAAEAR